MTAEPILQARGLVKRFGRVVALDHTDFDLYPGEILGVIGDNGAGKSTLIKALCGALTADAGEIRLAGEIVHFKSPIEAREAGIETVYQNLALSPALSIADNMFLGREIRMKSGIGGLFRLLNRPAMQKFARQKLNELGLMTIQNISQPVETLSGGQRQGVAVARAAAFARRVIIMDEPTAALGVERVAPGARAHPRRQEARPADHPHLAQHAACVRGRRPHPHPSARAAADRRRSEEGDDVGRRCDDDRRVGAAGGRARRLAGRRRLRGVGVSGTAPAAARRRPFPAPRRSPDCRQ